jgi:hypothetical protein
MQAIWNSTYIRYYSKRLCCIEVNNLYLTVIDKVLKLSISKLNYDFHRYNENIYFHINQNYNLFVNLML